MLKLGEQSIAALHLGDTKIVKAYLGEEVVFEAQKESLLPDGYTEIEYVALPDNTRVTNKSYVPFINVPALSTAVSIELKMYTPAVSTSNVMHVAAAYGSYSNPKTNACAIGFGRSILGDSGGVLCYHGDAGSSTYNKVVVTGTGEMTAVVKDDPTNKRITANGVSLSYSISSTYQKWVSKAHCLFTPGTGTNTGLGGCLQMSGKQNFRLYYVKYYDTAGNVVRNLVAAKSGYRVGFYDTIGKVFYTNGNTSTSSNKVEFVAGPDV